VVKELLIYCERVESGLREENDSLRGQLQDLQLDLEDSKKSRRELQQDLQHLETYTSSVNEETQAMKVRAARLSQTVGGVAVTDMRSDGRGTTRMSSF
jgi:predicted  nucleic acid-binding Zn-ribbon protein